MPVIYKYELRVAPKQVVMLPRSARILSLQVQREIPCIWAVVDPAHKADIPHTILMFATGEPTPSDLLTGFLGTIQLDSGALVFHVFER